MSNGGSDECVMEGGWKRDIEGREQGTGHQYVLLILT